MTLIEALKTNRRLRRVGTLTWWEPWSPWSRECVLSDDFEVEPEPKPELKAWMDKRHIIYMMSSAQENETCEQIGFIRAPWLDEP